MSRTSEADALRAVTRCLEARGFDLHAQGFGEALGDLAEPFGIEPSSPLLVTGNTRALWPAFVTARQRGEVGPPDPLDAYTEAAHEAALRAAGATARPLWAHRGTPVLPIQRVAERLGLCHVGPAGLAVHPVYGPWFGLRALLVFPPGLHGGAPLPTAPAPTAAPAPSAPLPGAGPCAGCAAPCRAAFDHARRATERLDKQGIAATWRLWVAARDACPVGREHRYSAAQLAHHYGAAEDG
ncbi:MAG: hypothetical protein KIT72_13165 [Polyangiaceae bacterium]|nr:hypothetical protein [Polyangiaceae bacterium]MCW5791361.1 hypothetical protein [Polyangiaceae bacterium]